MSKLYAFLLKQAERAVFEAAKERGWEQLRLGRPVMKPQEAIADVLRIIAERSGCERKKIFVCARNDRFEKWFSRINYGENLRGMSMVLYRDKAVWPYTDVPPGLDR
jgi:hypothetical protein